MGIYFFGSLKKYLFINIFTPIEFQRCMTNGQEIHDVGPSIDVSSTGEGVRQAKTRNDSRNNPIHLSRILEGKE